MDTQDMDGWDAFHRAYPTKEAKSAKMAKPAGLYINGSDDAYCVRYTELTGMTWADLFE